jgi:hypothetical protein
MKSHHDPVTGDQLTTGEYLSWRIQGLIRNWYFLALITVVTTLTWITANSVVLQWWNLSASYLALVIESIVGIAMFSQTRRDAVVLREVRALATHIDEQDKAILAILGKLNSQEDLIVQLLERRPVKRGTPRIDLEDEAILRIIGESL